MSTEKTKPSPETRRKKRRPDRPMYVPRARRSENAPGTTSVSAANVSEEMISTTETTDTADQLPSAAQTNLTSRTSDELPSSTHDGKLSTATLDLELKKEQKTGHRNAEEPKKVGCRDSTKKVSKSKLESVTKSSEGKQDMSNVDCKSNELTDAVNSNVLTTDETVALCSVQDISASGIASDVDICQQSLPSFTELLPTDDNSTDPGFSNMTETGCDAVSVLRTYDRESNIEGKHERTSCGLVTSGANTGDDLALDVTQLKVGNSDSSTDEQEKPQEQQQQQQLHQEQQQLEQVQQKPECEDNTSKHFGAVVVSNDAETKSYSCLHNTGTVDIPRASNRITPSTADICIDNSDDDDDDDDWDKRYNDSGEMLHQSNDIQISAVETAEKTGDRKAKVIDYYSYQPHPVDVNPEEFGHLIEIYDFPPELQTCDLLAAFIEFKDKGFDIKWVDDTHAVGIFSSSVAANSALCHFSHPMMKVQPVHMASRQTKLKARRLSDYLQPYKPRPETSATVARNLVAGALGLQTRVSREQRDLERRKLKEAKERKREAVKLKNDAWEGNIG